MKHFHYPDGRVLGAPDATAGGNATIGRHTGPIVNPRPYGYAHDSRMLNLPMQPQDVNFTPSRYDVVINPPEHHGVTNRNPGLLVLAV